MIRQRPTLCKSRALYFRGCLTPLVRQPLSFAQTVELSARLWYNYRVFWMQEGKLDGQAGIE